MPDEAVDLRHHETSSLNDRGVCKSRRTGRGWFLQQRDPVAVTMWVGPRQSKNAPYRKGENMDGMEVQENQAQRERQREREREREVEGRRTIIPVGRRGTERKKDKVYTYI